MVALGQSEATACGIVACIWGVGVGLVMNLFVTKDTETRHIYSTVCGMTIQYFLFREDIIHEFLMAGVAYALMRWLPRDQSAKAVTLWVFAYLFAQYLHLYLSTDEFEVNDPKRKVVRSTMMICAKL